MYIVESDIEKLLAFVADKKESRYILQNVYIKATGENEIEFAATDGAALCVMRRKLGEHEVAPEKPIMIDFPKMRKGGITIESCAEDENKVILTDSKFTKYAVNKTQGTYPNYNSVIPADVEKLPKASEFSVFSWQNMKKLNKVFAFYGFPRATKALGPHYWLENVCGKEWLVVMIPMAIKGEEENEK